MGPTATNQKFVLRATMTDIRPREPASRARDRQGSMGSGGALGFWVLGDEDAGDPDSWVSKGGEGGCGPRFLRPLSSRKGSRQAVDKATSVSPSSVPGNSPLSHTPSLPGSH